MYLKSIELVGFKSFAERTLLKFGPGMTCIVGPNGCGKSNVSDAIRWVLGEQSAKALRGAQMADVIFNGTDTHKPLGMAEVSITLADCEAVLGVEYNEVTITRRVFRSGEGQYFINKTPCRLKDIQRLFMDTGVGTNSYSLMEQGRIDKILSSHPEDRRAVFEEASGITKYKADRREAMRKLEQTEANLLRLEDVVKEVKRQIISLQRQAGKARRYQELHGRLRELDLFSARERLAHLDGEIRALEGRISSVAEQDEAIKSDIALTETHAQDLRNQAAAAEQKIQDAMEAAVRARTELDRVRELIRTNLDRIGELQNLSERDTRDADGARQNKAQHEQSLAEITEQEAQATARRNQADQELAEHVKRLNDADQRVSDANRLLHQLRTEQVDLEARAARLQNELAALDAEERQNIIRRERLAAESSDMQRNLEIFQSRHQEMTARLADLQQAVERAQRQLEAFQGQRADKSRLIQQLRQKLSETQSQVAARQAKIDMLKASEAERKGFPEGARQVLDPKSNLKTDRASVMGTLAELVRAEPEFHLALEATLRPWIDAVVIRDDASALSFLRELEVSARGPARLLSAESAGVAAKTDAPHALLAHLTIREEARPLVERMLGNVVVVDDATALPSKRDPALVYVTRTGVLAGPSGFELWKRENEQANPMARQQTLSAWEKELADLHARRDEIQSQITMLVDEETTVASAIDQARKELDENRRQLAQAEGENRVIQRDAVQARQRAETVAFELRSVEEKAAGGSGRRESIVTNIDQLKDRQAEIRTTIAQKTEELRDLDQVRTACMSEVTDRRVRFAEARQQVESLAQRREQTRARIDELSTLIEERARGVDSYRARIEELGKANVASEARIAPLEAQVGEHQQALDAARTERERLNISLAMANSAIREKRDQHDRIRESRSQHEVEMAQQQMRRQNLAERVTGEWRVTLDDVFTAPEPVWPEDQPKPDRDAIENETAELRLKIEAMGPVNLVAIEEHRELEERYTFLTTQQSDLTNAKQQLMELITQINKTTTDMFQDTFTRVNENFQQMFTQMFGGGTAKLVLSEDGDILEAGIDIIARPPGKKLQSVSLLSGGERTMTAVALLFALYMVKPSPFAVLDELDAALDEANIGRFVKTVQGFLDRSQFVVITHNRMTIAAADVLYGVTMEVRGVSKIVSVKFNSDDKRERAVVLEKSAAPAAVAVAVGPAPVAQAPATAPEKPAVAEPAPETPPTSPAG